MTDPSASDRRTPEPGEATTERVHSIFSGIADSYDLFNVLSSLGIDRWWRRRTVRLAGLTAGEHVLDLCAGTGDMSFALARTGLPATVTGTDFVAEMLEVARRKIDGYQGDVPVRFSQADAQDLPFDENSFDVTTVAFGVRNLPDRAANFSEVRRVLSPGGRYLILEFSRPPFAVFRWLYHAYLRFVIPALGSLLSGGDRASFQYLNDSILRFPAQEALAAELEDAGFSTVEWKNLTFGIVAVHIATV